MRGDKAGSLTVAQLIQFPFMVDYDGYEHGKEPSGQNAVGDGATYRLYKYRGGWAFVGCPAEELPALVEALGAAAADAAAIATAVTELDFKSLSAAVSKVKKAGVSRVTSLAQLRQMRTVETDATSPVTPQPGSATFARFEHPGGVTATLPLQTWHRPGASPMHRLWPAPLPGADTRDVLAEAGYKAEAIEQLFEADVVREKWPVLNNYLGG